MVSSKLSLNRSVCHTLKNQLKNPHLSRHSSASIPLAISPLAQDLTHFINQGHLVFVIDMPELHPLRVSENTEFIPGDAGEICG